MKTLLMVLVALCAWWLLRGLFRGSVSGEPPRPPTSADESPKKQLPQDTMVACAFCQLHLPRSEAVWSGETPFCGQAHLQAHQSQNPG